MDDDLRVCPECDMAFDWPGVEADGTVYCCEACSLGEPCECPQHRHEAMESDVPLPASMANQFGIRTPDRQR